LPLKAKKLKALACVFGVLFSEIIALTVLLTSARFGSTSGNNDEAGEERLTR
jgi:hypothetical protein